MVGDETSRATADEASASRRPTIFARFQRWVLVDGDRLFVAACISVGTFVFFLGLDWLGVISFANANSITRLASGMVAGTFSLVTLVVSINQLILSQEFTSAGAAEDRLEGVESFRSEVAKTIGDPVAPASPARVLEELFASIHGRATTLEDEADTLEGDAREDVRRYVRAVESSTERAQTLLSESNAEKSNTETFDAVSVAVEYDVSRHLYTAKRLSRHHEGALSRPAREALDRIVADLELFTVAREHIKTTYLQRELTRFSQLTILTGVPAITSALLIGFLYAGRTGAVIALPALPWVVSGLLAVVFVPLALLTAYILRTATITRRTVSIGPLVLESESGSTSDRCTPELDSR
ncbi:hypothetical protein [Natronosalvus caseinilyticus]|uniref:hypothetical protein n=1 Tax=Natronosalvus caseinilyticus TaxID=2953747 RepID=UPI0028A8D237|nr:hypothetical protein [Natronosalvus caseinilyticus]